MTDSIRMAAGAAAIAVAVGTWGGALRLVSAQTQTTGRGQGTAGTQTSTTRDNTTQQQSQTPAPTGEIDGTVVVASAGTPVRRAQISLTAQEIRGQRSAISDDKGHFSFGALPAGRYTVSATKPAYVRMVYGAKAAGRSGTPIQLVDGQKFDHADIALPKGSVVTGIVVDENGEASPGTQVRVLRYVSTTGLKTLQQAGTAQTDDRGVYRIYGLQPGDYIVSASPRNVNIGDVRQSIMAQIDQLMQEAQADTSAAGQNGAGGGRNGGRGGGPGAGANNQAANVGRGRAQQSLSQADALQQQLADLEKEQTVGYAPVYYPGTTTPANAVTVTLAVAEEHGAIDFQLQLVPTAIVTGTVTSPDGHLPQGTQITLTPTNAQGMPPVPGVGSNTARVGADGKFAFTGVTPGQYTIAARGTVRQVDPTQTQQTQTPAQSTIGQRGGRGAFLGGGPGGRGGIVTQVLWASADVTVTGQNLPDVALQLQPGMAVSGHVEFHGTTLQPPSDLTRIRVTMSSSDPNDDFTGNMPPAQVDANGNFTIVGVPPGHYTLRGQAPAGGATTNGSVLGGRGGGRGGGGGGPAGSAGGNWSLKSAVVDGRDSLDFPFEVKPNSNVSNATVSFVDTTQTLKGTLQDSTGRPTSDYTIIVFAADASYWTPQSRRIASTRPGTDGTYTIRGLPSGEYKIMAVTDVDQGEWYDPSFLSQYANSSLPVSISDGQTRTQDLKLAGGS